jgi:ABC-type transporter Mla subunit MlaD
VTPPKDKTQEQGPQAEAEELREEIAETREGLGDTVEQLAQKADVKAQAHAKVDETKQHAQAQVHQVKEKPAPVAAAIGAVIGGLLLLLWLRRR